MEVNAKQGDEKLRLGQILVKKFIQRAHDFRWAQVLVCPGVDKGAGLGHQQGGSHIMAGDVGDENIQILPFFDKKIIIVPSNQACGFARSGQGQIGYIGNTGWEQAELDGFGDFQLFFLTPGLDQFFRLPGVAPGNPDLPGQTFEKLHEFFCENAFDGARKG